MTARLSPPPVWRQSLMLLVLAVDVALLIGLILAVVWLVPAMRPFAAIASLGLMIGWLAGILQRRGDGVRHEAEEARVGRALDRLCLVGDIARPDVRVPGRLPPLSWTSQVPFRRPRIIVTQAMAAELTDDQLEAAVAHELTHIANGDAWLMTLVAGPPAAQLAGVRHLWTRDGLKPKMATLLFLGWTVPPCLVLMGLARVVSRNRELAADRGAAVLTGSPAALAATLTALSGELEKVRDRDLRVAASADVFHLLPAREPSRLGRLWATHPPLERRLAEFDAMERRLHERV